MNITFTHLTMQNFCGVKELDIDFYDRTIIKGQNKSGKTTVKNAIYWVLFNRLADGSSPDNIRPHDENGVDVDMIDISVTLTMEADGKEIVVKKTQKQNWVTDRTTQEQKFKGNVNEYEINGIPKKEKDFADYMTQFISPELLSLCTNPQVFLRLDTKKRRALLFDMIDGADTEVVDSDPKFAELKSDLMDGTVEELIARSKKAISSYKDKLVEIPARIDELNLQIKELTDDEKAELTSELSAEEEKLSALDAKKDTINELNKRISDGKIKLNEIATNARLATQKAEADLSLHKQTLTNNLSMYGNHLKTAQDTVVKAQRMIETHNLAIADYERGIKAEQEREFDEASLSCPMCGRKYPDGKQTSIREHFEKEKADKIESLESLIASTKELVAIEEEKISKANEDIQKLQIDIEELNAELTKASTEVITATADYTTDAEYLKTQADIAKWQIEVENLNTAEDATARMTINNRISEIKLALGREQTNDSYKARIAELNAEQLATSQKIADEERKVDLLQAYQIAKVNLLTERINAFFNVIKWQMFKQQINGGFAEVCTPLVNGTSYDGLLNHGDKILAEIDLCQAFQKANNVTCPIIIDDTESLDSWRVPELDNQLIVLRRTDDKSLVIESLA